MKTEEQVLVEETYKAQYFEEVAGKIVILEDFRELTTSSALPVGLKNRFLAIADKDIDRLVSCLKE